MHCSFTANAAYSNTDNTMLTIIVLSYILTGKINKKLTAIKDYPQEIVPSI